MEKYYLGKVCLSNHIHEKTGMTLRYKSDRDCVLCKKQKRKKRNEERMVINLESKYLGDICQNNHNYNRTNKSLRFTSNGYCVECKKNIDNKTYQKNKEKILKNKKKYYNKNFNNIKKRNKDYYQKNKEHIIEQNKKYYHSNKKHLNTINWKRRKVKLLKDPIFRLNCNMSNAIAKALKLKNSTKENKSYLKLVNFTIMELKKHLESQFENGMTWENYGQWHVDHIIPKSRFKYTSAKDETFKICWSLNNFQPLWKKDNLSKNNKTMEEYLKTKK